MTARASFLFVAYLTFSVHTTAAADKWENIVPNPGFEEVTAEGWAMNWPRPNRNWQVDETVSHSGKRSLTVLNTDPNLYAFPAVPVPCEPGQSYDISAWVKTKGVKVGKEAMGSSLGATICLEWSDADGKWLGGFYEVHGPLGTQDWQRISAENVPIPKDAKRVTFTVYMRQGLVGQAWFDDVSVSRHRKPLLITFLSKPNYRGTFFAPGKGKLLLTLNLEDHDLGPESAVVKVGVGLSPGLGALSAQKTAWLREVPLRTGTMDFEFSSSEIPDGVSSLIVIVVRKDTGDVVATATQRLEKRPPPTIPGGAWIDERNTLVVDGKPYFPLGWYLHGGIGQPEGVKDLESIAASSFNCVMNYGTTFAAPEIIQAYMDKAQQLGLKVIFSIKDVYHGSQYCPHWIKSQADEEPFVRRMVGLFGAHPALLAWYLNDELPPRYLRRLRERQRLMCEIEPNHPTWIVHYYDQEKLLSQYADTTDVMGVDPYPVSRRSVTYVSRLTDAAVASGKGARPVWVVPQAFGWYMYNKEVRAGKRPPTEKELQAGREPTLDEVRCMSYLALIHGAKGLVYYSYSDLKKSPNFESRWAGMKEIAAELKSLSDIILAGDRVAPASVTCDQNTIDFGQWHKDGVSYILATNTSDLPCKAVFTLPPPLPRRVARFNSTGEMVLTGATFTEEFGPFACRAYVLK